MLAMQRPRSSQIFAGAFLVVLGTGCAAADDTPSLGFRILVDGAIWSKQQWDNLFGAPGFGNLMDRVAATTGQNQPKSVLRALLVEGADVTEMALVYSFADELKRRLATDVDKYSMVKKNLSPIYHTPKHPYEFAGTLFGPNQIPILLEGLPRPLLN